MSVVASPPPRAPARLPADWRVELPESRRKALRIWFWSIAGMTFLTLVVGGITRLTQSGLSIVDWQPFVGVVPPLNGTQWQEVFDRYRSFPEYLQLRRGMSLSEFKFIFFWEYLHRVVARVIGVVFLLPFVVFVARGFMNGPLLRRSLLLFGLGASQGAMGWFMVSSGLADSPRVSHYRLAAHLSLAFVIFSYAVWLARDLAVTRVRTPLPAQTHQWLRTGILALGALLGVQVVWGAFVAGLDAGLYYNTFPLMGGGLVPPDYLRLSPALLNLVENPGLVQWVHRLLGTLLLGAALWFAYRLRGEGVDPRSRKLGAAYAGGLVLQYLLGVATLLLMVPVSLGVAHQGMAMILMGIWVVWWHHAREVVESGGRGGG